MSRGVAGIRVGVLSSPALSVYSGSHLIRASSFSRLILLLYSVTRLLLRLDDKAMRVLSDASHRLVPLSHALALSLSLPAPHRTRFFLLLAALLRRREELLVTTGPKLRVLLAETLSPPAMATLLGSENGNAADADNKTNAELALWCQEAEALDLATPESFRHHLALIGEIAEAEYEVSGGTGIIYQQHERGVHRPDLELVLLVLLLLPGMSAGERGAVLC